MLSVPDQAISLAGVSKCRHVFRPHCCLESGGGWERHDSRIKLCGGRPELSVLIAGRTVNSVLDTGSQVSVVSEDCLRD